VFWPTAAFTSSRDSTHKASRRKLEPSAFD
jgi:hypothetical protein